MGEAILRAVSPKIWDYRYPLPILACRRSKQISDGFTEFHRLDNFNIRSIFQDTHQQFPVVGIRQP